MTTTKAVGQRSDVSIINAAAGEVTLVDEGLNITGMGEIKRKRRET
jgi:enoyl-[acyl-carrier-protein] reductase (NADH)